MRYGNIDCGVSSSRIQKNIFLGTYSCNKIRKVLLFGCSYQLLIIENNTKKTFNFDGKLRFRWPETSIFNNKLNFFSWIQILIFLIGLLYQFEQSTIWLSCVRSFGYVPPFIKSRTFIKSSASFH